MKKVFAALALCVTLALTGCVASPVAQSITEKQRVAFEEACNEARGDVSGVNTKWSVPTCIVRYQYPSFPGQQGSK